MTEKKILTKHPRGMNGVRISREKYDVMRKTLVNLLRSRGDLTYTELAAAANKKLAGKFDGSINWYAAVVKLDLEARKVIKPVPGTKPPRWKLARS